jgi:endonuclease YncB( thermonuclease family)
VTVREKGRDRYGRTVAEIALPDGCILNRELVDSVEPAGAIERVAAESRRAAAMVRQVGDGRPLSVKSA